MCGIIATLNPKDTSQTVIRGLKTLLSRGADSWGIGSFSFKTNVHKFSGNNIVDNPVLFHKEFDNRHAILGHTRWASVGSQLINNIQPINTIYFLMVHNGTLTYKIGDFSDSHHSDSYWVAQNLKHYFINDSVAPDSQDIYNDIFNKFDGTAAIVLAPYYHSDKLYFICKGSPLYYWDGRFASSLDALPNEEGILIPDNSHGTLCNTTCYTYGSPNYKLTLNNSAVSDEYLQRNKIVSNTKCQILDETINKMLTEMNEQSSLSFDYSFRLPSIIPELNPKINLIGCGSSYNAALLGKYYFKLASNKDVSVYYSTEFDDSFNDNINIFITQSGETLDTLEPLRRLNGYSKCYLITNNEQSTAANLLSKSHIFPLKVNKENAVAATKTFMGTCLSLLRLAKPSYYEDINLNGFRRDIKSILNNELIQVIASQLHSFKYHLVMGCNLDYPIAKEISLKLREVARINSEGLVCENYKHGSCALTTKDFCGIVLIPDVYDKKFDRALNCVKQIKARDGYVIAIGHDIINEASITLTVPKAPQVLSPLLKVVVGQLLSYYSAIEQGFPTDQLQNCAKAITVH